MHTNKKKTVAKLDTPSYIQYYNTGHKSNTIYKTGPEPFLFYSCFLVLTPFPVAEGVIFVFFNLLE